MTNSEMKCSSCNADVTFMKCKARLVPPSSVQDVHVNAVRCNAMHNLYTRRDPIPALIPLNVTPYPECHPRDTRAGMLRCWTIDATDTSHYLWPVYFFFFLLYAEAMVIQEHTCHLKAHTRFINTYSDRQSDIISSVFRVIQNLLTTYKSHYTIIT